MSDRNVSGSLGVETHLRIGSTPNDIILSANSDGTALLVDGAVVSAVGTTAGGDLTGTYPNPTLAATVVPRFSPGVPMTSGKYFNPNGTGGTGTTGANSRAVLTRVLFGKACTLNAISMDVTAAGTATSVFRFGIYADTDGKPGARIADLGTVPADAIAVPVLAISQAVGAQWYWICTAAQGQASLATYRTPSVVILPSMMAYATPGGSANNISYFFDTGFSGALPDPAGTETGVLTSSNVPSLWLRAV